MLRTKQWAPQREPPGELLTPAAEMPCNSQLQDKAGYGGCAIKGSEIDQCKNPQEGLCVGEMETYLTWPEGAGV